MSSVPSSERCSPGWGQQCGDPTATARRSHVVPSDGWVMLRTASGLEYPAACRVAVLRLPAQAKPAALKPGSWAVWRVSEPRELWGPEGQLAVRVLAAGPARSAVAFGREVKVVPTHELLPVDNAASVELAREDRRLGRCGAS